MRATLVPRCLAGIAAALALATAFVAPVSACRFCRPGSEYDRYAPDDPMSAFAPDAAAIARGQEAGGLPVAATVAAVPKPEDIVTSRAALTAAVAAAPAPAPDSPAPMAGSYRERLLRPVSYSPPAAAAATVAPSTPQPQSPSVGLSVAAARVVDGALVLAVLGVIGFFLWRPRKESTDAPAGLDRLDTAH